MTRKIARVGDIFLRFGWDLKYDKNIGTIAPTSLKLGHEMFCLKRKLEGTHLVNTY